MRENERKGRASRVARIKSPKILSQINILIDSSIAETLSGHNGQGGCIKHKIMTLQNKGELQVFKHRRIFRN